MRTKFLQTSLAVVAFLGGSASVQAQGGGCTPSLLTCIQNAISTNETCLKACAPNNHVCGMGCYSAVLLGGIGSCQDACSSNVAAGPGAKQPHFTPGAPVAPSKQVPQSKVK